MVVYMKMTMTRMGKMKFNSNITYILFKLFHGGDAANVLTLTKKLFLIINKYFFNNEL